jgi:hypothetical protein
LPIVVAAVLAVWIVLTDWPIESLSDERSSARLLRPLAAK